MKKLLKEIRQCTICSSALAHEPRPVLAADPKSKIIIIGQAPGSVVHSTGVPWDDKSGNNLRKWMDISKETFYDTSLISIIPMGFCYPGKGKSGDLAPRKECAPQWHNQLLNKLTDVQLILLIGKYAQDYYLGKKAQRNLTLTVQNYEDYLPEFFVLPHPSPRNNIWMKRNDWFAAEILPRLKGEVKCLLS